VFVKCIEGSNHQQFFADWEYVLLIKQNYPAIWTGQDKQSALRKSSKNGRLSVSYTFKLFLLSDFSHADLISGFDWQAYDTS